MLETLENLWAELFAVASVVLAIGLAIGVILRKRDDRSAIGWLGVLLLSPPLGSIAFLLFGINRIRRRARIIRAEHGDHDASVAPAGGVARTAHNIVPADRHYLVRLARLTDQVVRRPLVGGNQISPLVDGIAAFPTMIEAIDNAERSVALATYIFQRDEVGMAFIDALGKAKRRGVEVRVLIDGLGSHYSRPSVVDDLRGQSIATARFLHSFWPWQMPYLNLRSHKKLLIADGQVGFTGGMNISGKHLAAGAGLARFRDAHFKVEGPVVGQLTRVFADDWAFTTGESLNGDGWFPELASAGSVHARAITSGPDQDSETIRWVILGAVTQATYRVSIATPYFVPDQQMVTALSLAALRGVEVDVVMPSQNNLPLVKWASKARMEELIVAGCHLWMSQPPFDHSKLLAIDDAWGLIGSANWDERSLRLNFELNVECFGSAFAQSLRALVDAKRSQSEAVTLEALRDRTLPVKLRDGVARLFSPYL